MTDTTTIPAAGEAKSPRPSMAKHEMIRSEGGEHLGIDTAVGIRYIDKASNDKFEFIIPVPPKAKAKGVTHDDLVGSALMMFALFGAKTKATNETSKVRQSGKTDSVSQLEALDEVFESISNEVWREQAEGGGGSRTDKALLAAVLIELLGTGAKGNVEHYVQRFTDDTKYMQQVLKSDAGTEYRKRAGKTGPAIDSLA